MPELTTTIPARSSDSGPSTRTCLECGEIYAEGHDCQANWDANDWLYLVEENARAATRVESAMGCGLSLAERNRTKIDIIEHAEVALAKAKALLKGEL